MYDSIQSLKEFDSLSNTIEFIMIGNHCLNELNTISFNRFGNVMVIDVGKKSLLRVKSLSLNSMMIYD